MQRKYLISYIQVTLLIAAVTFGSVLYNEPSDTLRTAHRSVGLLAALVGIIVVVLNRKVTGVAGKITGTLSVIATFVAGYAGNSLKSTDNYDQMFNLMRGMGFTALVLSVITFILLRRYSKNRGYSIRPDGDQ